MFIFFTIFSSSLNFVDTAAPDTVRGNYYVMAYDFSIQLIRIYQ